MPSERLLHEIYIYMHLFASRRHKLKNRVARPYCMVESASSNVRCSARVRVLLSIITCICLKEHITSCFPHCNISVQYSVNSIYYLYQDWLPAWSPAGQSVALLRCPTSMHGSFHAELYTRGTYRGHFYNDGQLVSYISVLNATDDNHACSKQKMHLSFLAMLATCTYYIRTACSTGWLACMKCKDCLYSGTLINRVSGSVNR